MSGNMLFMIMSQNTSTGVSPLKSSWLFLKPVVSFPMEIFAGFSNGRLCRHKIISDQICQKKFSPSLLNLWCMKLNCIKTLKEIKQSSCSIFLLGGVMLKVNTFSVKFLQLSAVVWKRLHCTTHWSGQLDSSSLSTSSSLLLPCDKSPPTRTWWKKHANRRRRLHRTSLALRCGHATPGCRSGWHLFSVWPGSSDLLWSVTPPNHCSMPSPPSHLCKDSPFLSATVCYGLKSATCGCRASGRLPTKRVWRELTWSALVERSTKAGAWACKTTVRSSWTWLRVPGEAQWTYWTSPR